MQQRRATRQQRVMTALWSEFLALWRDRTRRPALPLLLATLLLLVPSLPANANCSCEQAEAQQTAHHHAASEAQQHHCGKAEAHREAAEPAFGAQCAPMRPAHAQRATSTPSVESQTTTNCCSCAPASAVNTFAPAPFQSGAHSLLLTYGCVSATPVYRCDSLAGLFGRAGPPGSKPQRLCLASLAGRAPPFSL